MGNSKQGQSKNIIRTMVTKLFLFLTLIGLVVSTWMFISWLNKPGNFPIKKVELINKLENQGSRELQKVAANALNGGFFSLNVELFRTELLTHLPWVKNVSVRKMWPDKLLIEIIEHKPVVRWLSTQKDKNSKAGSKMDLLSNEGVVFTPKLTEEQKKRFSSWALFNGPINSAGMILKYCVQMNEQLKQLDLSLVRCGMNERRSWVINLNNNMTVKLGKEDVMQKLNRFISVFMNQLKQYLDVVDSADLRYANGFTIQWNSENNVDVKSKREQE